MGSVTRTDDPISIGILEAIHRAQVVKSMRSKRGGAHRKWSAVDGLITEFLAEYTPDEGLDIMLGQFPKNDTRITTLSLCLFTSQTGTTVMTGTQTVSSITETTYTSYARQGLATASWAGQGASTVAGDGRKIAYTSQITFPTVGATGATINGSFMGWDTGAGGTATPTKCVAQANFDDGLAITVVTNDVVKVTPSLQINH